jgi:ubiquitin carboxyl-terminal hydrolase 8
LARRAFSATFARNGSGLVDAMYGQCVSHVASLDTAYTSARFEAFSSLSLPIPDDVEQVTVYDCLAHYFREEIMEDLFDDVTRTRVRARKQHCITRLPGILVITLLRFDARAKISTHVGVPDEIDLKPYTHSAAFGSGSGAVVPPTTYRLFGIVNHVGDMSHGHYTALCRTDGNWRHFDDGDARETPLQHVVTPHAYILFFRQCQDRIGCSAASLQA